MVRILYQISIDRYGSWNREKTCTGKILPWLNQCVITATWPHTLMQRNTTTALRLTTTEIMVNVSCLSTPDIHQGTGSPLVDKMVVLRIRTICHANEIWKNWIGPVNSCKPDHEMVYVLGSKNCYNHQRCIYNRSHWTMRFDIHMFWW